MNPSEFFSGAGGDAAGNRPSPRKELQGPRPAVLKVNKDSHMIRKPPIPPHHHHHHAPSQAPADDRQPVIIYAVSPKVIHTTADDFMNLVQRLTGNTTASTTSAAAGDLSPAARFASIERTSPSYRDREIVDVGDIMSNILESTDVDLGRFSGGILSPAPATLPPISPGFFSPAGDPFMMGFGNMFLPSPSGLFSSPTVVSPSFSSCDLFSAFFDS